jgi:hypothetical protein
VDDERLDHLLLGLVDLLREAVDLSMSGPPEKVSLQNSVKSFKGQKESD